MVSRTLRKVSPEPLEWLTQVNEWNLLDPNDHFTGEVSVGFRRKLSKVLKIMVGPCGLEPQTSTVSKRRDYVLPITYKALETALVRASTAKPNFLQVKLQVKKLKRNR